MSSDAIPFSDHNFDVEEGFLPYCVEWLMPAVYRRTALSPDLSGEEMIEQARSRCVKENPRFCLVLGPASCWYIQSDGSLDWSDCPPGGGVVIEPSTSSFGCGYCCQKGGPDELRAFVEARRKRDEERRNQP